MKILLVFAHFAEASCFIEKMEAFEIKDFRNLFLSKNTEILLLISGEEKLSIIMNLCKVFFTYPEIKSVYNFGICAALRDDLKMESVEGEVLSIRTLYGYEMEPNFKSYTTDDEGAKLDLMSYFERVQSKETAEKLSYFAPILDREAYTIASVVRKYPVKFYVYKIISDFADGKIAQSEIIGGAKEYSKKLYEFFYKQFFSSEKSLNKISKEAKSKNYLESFYMTKQQKRLLEDYEALLEKNKGFCLDEFLAIKEVQENLKESLTPKNKTKLLINLLEKTLNPLEHRFKKEMEQILNPLKKVGVDFEINVMNFRKSRFSFYFDNKEALLKKLKTIESFNVGVFESLSQGQIDV